MWVQVGTSVYMVGTGGYKCVHGGYMWVQVDTRYVHVGTRGYNVDTGGYTCVQCRDK